MEKIEKIFFGIFVLVIFLSLPTKIGRAQTGMCVENPDSLFWEEVCQFEFLDPRKECSNRTQENCEDVYKCCKWVPFSLPVTHCRFKEGAPPECRNVPCHTLSEEYCKRAEECCVWEGPPEEWECDICPGCKGGGLGEVACRLQCAIGYLIFLPVRIFLLFIGLIGVYLGTFLSFITFKVVPPIINEVIETSLALTYVSKQTQIEGIWEVIRNFALNFVYIFLLIVGLATIFKLAEYEAKKALVPLIIAALAIHFSFTIASKLIELGNDLTKLIKNTLWQATRVSSSEGGFLNSENLFRGVNRFISQDSVKVLGHIFCGNGHWSHYFSEKDGGPIVLRVMLAALAPWIVASIIVFILFCFIRFGLLFVYRTIWFIALLLVSPIAFLSIPVRRTELRHVFPGFLNWEDWFKTLLEWAFVGVGLMIWLGVAGLIANFPELFSTQPASLRTAAGKAVSALTATSTATTIEELPTALEEIALALLPSIGAGVALFFGAATIPKLGEAFANAAFGFLKTVGTAMIAGAALGIGGAIGGAAGVIGSAVKSAPGIEGKLVALATSLPRAVGVFGKEAILTTGKEIAKTGLLAPIPKEMREPMISAWARRVSPAEIEKRIEEIERTQGPRGVQAIITSPWANDLERMTAIRRSLEGGYFEDAWLQEPRIQDSLFRIYEEAVRKGDRRTMGKIERRFVTSSQIIDELGSRYQNITRQPGRTAREIIASARTADEIKQLPRGWWARVELLDAAFREWGGNQWEIALREFGPGLVNAVNNRIRQLATVARSAPRPADRYRNFAWRRAGIFLLSESGAGRSLGLISAYDVAPPEFQQQYRNLREAIAR